MPNFACHSLLARLLLTSLYADPEKPDIRLQEGESRDMSESFNSRKSRMQINIMDAFLYLLAGSAMAIISVSFLLWLRF